MRLRKRYSVISHSTMKAVADSEKRKTSGLTLLNIARALMLRTAIDLFPRSLEPVYLQVLRGERADALCGSC